MGYIVKCVLQQNKHTSIFSSSEIGIAVEYVDTTVEGVKLDGYAIIFKFQPSGKYSFHCRIGIFVLKEICTQPIIKLEKGVLDTEDATVEEVNEVTIKSVVAKGYGILGVLRNGRKVKGINPLTAQEVYSHFGGYPGDPSFNLFRDLVLYKTVRVRQSLNYDYAEVESFNTMPNYSLHIGFKNNRWFLDYQEYGDSVRFTDFKWWRQNTDDWLWQKEVPIGKR